jgi:sugar lactone lactonase YvrE
VTSLLNTGPGTPDGLVFDNNGDIVYSLNAAGQVGIFNPATNANRALASGFSASASDLVLDPGGTTVLLADKSNNRVVRIDLTTGAVSALGGSIAVPNGIASDNYDNLFVVSTNNGAGGGNSLLQLNPATGAVLRTIPLHSAGYTDGLAFDPVTCAFWVADNASGLIEVSNYLSSPHVQEFSSPIGGSFDGVESDGQGNLYVTDSQTRLVKYAVATNTFVALPAAVSPDRWRRSSGAAPGPAR